MNNDVNNTIQGSGQIGLGSGAYAFALTNNGTITANQSSSLTVTPGNGVTNNGTIEVNSGSTLAITDNLTNFSGNTLTGGAYYVAGTFKFAGANIVTNAATITLDGTASTILNQTNSANALTGFNTNAAAGSFTLKDGRTLTAPTTTGTFTNAGSMTIQDTAEFSASGAYLQTGGTTTLVSGGSLDPTQSIEIQTGVLQGTGTVIGNLQNSGTVIPGSAAGGTMTVTGNYTQSAGGSLTVDVGGSPGSGEFGVLSVSGTASLAGTLNANLVNGFGPTAQDNYNYTVLSARSTSGSFANLNGSLGSTPLLNASVMSASVVLTTTGNPAPDLAPQSITLPPVGEVGKEVSVTYTVQDLTATAVPASYEWYDNVYLSPDGQLADATLLGTVQNTGGVAGNASYQATLTAVIPAIGTGPYQVIVVADAQDIVPDSNRANNTLASGSTFQVNPPTVLSVTGTTPAAGQVTQAFSSVTIHFSKAIQASSFTNAQVSIAGPNGSIAVSNITEVDATDYTILFSTQTINGDYNFTIGPNILDLLGYPMSAAYSFTLLLAQTTPDLATSMVTVAATGLTGQQAAVSWQVTNQGTAATAAAGWSDQVYLSADGQLDSSSISLGTFLHTGASAQALATANPRT